LISGRDKRRRSRQASESQQESVSVVSQACIIQAIQSTDTADFALHLGNGALQDTKAIFLTV
jgi:hypothetical protein